MALETSLDCRSLALDHANRYSYSHPCTSKLASLLVFASGVSIPLGYEDLQQCPPKLFQAERLRDLGEPGCNLQGSSLNLPDGNTLGIGEVGVVQSQQFMSGDGSPSPEYLVVNWGIPGVGVSKIMSRETVSWATSDAGRWSIMNAT